MVVIPEASDGCILRPLCKGYMRRAACAFRGWHAVARVWSSREVGFRAEHPHVYLGGLFMSVPWVTSAVESEAPMCYMKR